MATLSQFAPCIHLHIDTERPCPKCFVHELHRKAPHTHPETPEDCTCSICFTNYNSPNTDTTTIETHVHLPCGHAVGNHCLIRWLTPAPYGGNGSTCPMCQHVLFKAYPKRESDEIERSRALADLEELRAISQRMLRASVQHHQNMAIPVRRMPSVDEVLCQQHRRDSKLNPRTEQEPKLKQNRKSKLLERILKRSSNPF